MTLRRKISTIVTECKIYIYMWYIYDGDNVSLGCHRKKKKGFDGIFKNIYVRFFNIGFKIINSDTSHTNTDKMVKYK